MSWLAGLALQTNMLGFEVLASIGIGGQLDGFVEQPSRGPPASRRPPAGEVSDQRRESQLALERC